MTKPLPLPRFPIHLGAGGHALPQPEFTGMEWYGAYTDRHSAEGPDSRLVQLYSFSESWTSWERHPAGDEVVVCTQGEITLIQDLPGGPQSVTLHAGDYAINQKGIWHTADISESATAMFITVGWGTEHRER